MTQNVGELICQDCGWKTMFETTEDNEELARQRMAYHRTKHQEAPRSVEQHIDEAERLLERVKSSDMPPSVAVRVAALHLGIAEARMAHADRHELVAASDFDAEDQLDRLERIAQGNPLPVAGDIVTARTFTGTTGLPPELEEGGRVVGRLSVFDHRGPDGEPSPEYWVTGWSQDDLPANLGTCRAELVQVQVRWETVKVVYREESDE